MKQFTTLDEEFIDLIFLMRLQRKENNIMNKRCG